MSTIEKKSRYQQKLRRKMACRRVDPKWMWWIERSKAPVAKATQPKPLEIVAG